MMLELHACLLPQIARLQNTFEELSSLLRSLQEWPPLSLAVWESALAQKQASPTQVAVLESTRATLSTLVLWPCLLALVQLRYLAIATETQAHNLITSS